MRGRQTPDFTPRALSCPRCEVPLTVSTLTTAAERWEVEVDVCSHSCGGVWLDKEDFHVDPKANLLLNQALLTFNVPALKGVAPEGQAECPVCQVPMAPYAWKHTDVPLDRCAQCRGLWFDGHEIDAVQRQLREKQARAGLAAAGSQPSLALASNRRKSHVPMVLAAVVLVALAGLGLKGVLTARPPGAVDPGVSARALVLGRRTAEEQVRHGNQARPTVRQVYYVKFRYQAKVGKATQVVVAEERVKDRAAYDWLKPGVEVPIRYDRQNPRSLTVETPPAD